MVNPEKHIEKVPRYDDECCFCGKEIHNTIISYQNVDTKEVLCGLCIQETSKMLLTRNVFLTWDDAIDIQMNDTYDEL
jgi:hypothetical protein|tara:strand:- start:4298 stop:4531 length:234 start_codon:yes stop_codon:yes gene_type:complete